MLPRHRNDASPVIEAMHLLVVVDCSKLTHDTALLCEHLKRNHQVMFSEGAEYGGNGHDFIRINVACPRSTMQEGFNRLFAGLRDFR